MRLFIVLLGWLWCLPVCAHAVLNRVEPKDGAYLIAPPPVYQLEFNEPVVLLSLKLTSPSGQETALSAAGAAGSSLALSLPPEMPKGPWLMRWQVRSADGHIISGASSFGIGTVAQAAGPVVPHPAWNRIAAMLLLLLPALAAAGGALLPAGLQLPGGRLWALGALLLLIPACSLSGWDGEESRWLMLALALLLLCAGPAGGGWPARAGALAVAVILGSDGHARLIGWAGWLMPLHLLLAGWWLAGVLALLKAPLRAGSFGNRAILLVPLLPLGGLAAGLLITGGPQTVSAAYGGLLLAKLGLTVGLFVLAALNRWWLNGSPRLLLSLKAEAVLLVLTLLLAGVVQAVPPRQPPPPPGISYHLHGGGFHGEAELMASGELRLLLLSEADGAPATVQEVTFDLDGLERPGRLTEPGVWTAAFGLLPPARRTLTATILVDDFTRVSLRAAAPGS